MRHRAGCHHQRVKQCGGWKLIRMTRAPQSQEHQILQHSAQTQRMSPGWLVLDVWLTAYAQLRPLVKHLNQDVRAATAQNHIDWIRIHSHLLQFSWCQLSWHQSKCYKLDIKYLDFNINTIAFAAGSFYDGRQNDLPLVSALIGGAILPFKLRSTLC